MIRFSVPGLLNIAAINKITIQLRNESTYQLGLTAELIGTTTGNNDKRWSNSSSLNALVGSNTTIVLAPNNEKITLKSDALLQFTCSGTDDIYKFSISRITVS